MDSEQRERTEGGRDPDAPDPDVRDEAEAAHQAEIVELADRLVAARRRAVRRRVERQESLREIRHPRIDELEEAIRTRGIIGRATDILRATGFSEEEARLLERAARPSPGGWRVTAELAAGRAVGGDADVDPVERARRAVAAMGHHRAALDRLDRERTAAIGEALRRGVSRQEISRQLGGGAAANGGAASSSVPPASAVPRPTRRSAGRASGSATEARRER